MKRYDRCEKHGIEGHGCDKCKEEELYKIKESKKLGDLAKFLENYIPCFVEQYENDRYFYILDADDIDILAYRLLKWWEIM